MGDWSNGGETHSHAARRGVEASEHEDSGQVSLRQHEDGGTAVHQVLSNPHYNRGTQSKLL